MTLNLQALGWYLFADFLVLGAFKIYAPEFLTTQNIVVLQSIQPSQNVFDYALCAWIQRLNLLSK